MGGPHKAGDKQRTYWISPALEAKFKAFAKSRNLSMSELIRTSIDFYREAIEASQSTQPSSGSDDEAENSQNGHDKR